MLELTAIEGAMAAMVASRARRDFLLHSYLIWFSFQSVALLLLYLSAIPAGLYSNIYFAMTAAGQGMAALLVVRAGIPKRVAVAFSALAIPVAVWFGAGKTVTALASTIAFYAFVGMSAWLVAGDKEPFWRIAFEGLGSLWLAKAGWFLLVWAEPSLRPALVSWLPAIGCAAFGWMFFRFRKGRESVAHGIEDLENLAVASAMR